MEWLEQNIDAYRIMADILRDFRGLYEKTLETVYGPDWINEESLESVLAPLRTRQREEQSIDWYETEHQALMSYATFNDFLAILNLDDSIFPAVTALAPSQPLLHTRFLELEVMRNKLGRARPISEAELSFLGSFHVRFRKTLAEAMTAPPTRSRSQRQPAPATRDMAESDDTGGDAIPHDEPIDAASPDNDTNGPISEERDENSTMPIDELIALASANDSETEVEIGGADSNEGAEASPPRAPRRQSQSYDRGQPVSPPEAETTTGRRNLTTALEEGDTRQILQELYREITNTAEAMWSDNPPISAPVWEQVRVSNWYETQFSQVGLKPISDFYEVITSFHDRLESGVSTEEVQLFLKDCNFAQVLLALRDMFQRQSVQ